MEKINVSVARFEKRKVIDFIAESDREGLGKDDFKLMEGIEKETLPSGFIVTGSAMLHPVRFNKKPSASSTFIQWSSVRELVIDDSTLHFHMECFTYPITFENPVVLKGAYNFFCWHIRQHLMHPIPQPVETKSYSLDPSQVNFTTGNH